MKLLAMAAAGSAMTPYDVRPKRPPIPKHKAEQPKCKSCVHFGEARRCCEPMKVCCNVKYTFATKKLKGGSCLLFAKEKYSYEKYRIVCKDGYPARFKTKTSAHIAAEAIHENGIADSGYELGETYNE